MDEEEEENREDSEDQGPSPHHHPHQVVDINSYKWDKAGKATKDRKARSLPPLDELSYAGQEECSPRDPPLEIVSPISAKIENTGTVVGTTVDNKPPVTVGAASMKIPKKQRQDVDARGGAGGERAKDRNEDRNGAFHHEDTHL